MFLHRNKAWWDAAIDRAERTIAQSFLSMLPVGLIITPQMIKEADWSIIGVILGWILTGLFGGLASLLTSYVKGIPEVDK